MKTLEHRKGTTVIRLLHQGAPVIGQKVSVRQLQHSFLFGCGSFDAMALNHTKDEKEKSFYEQRMKKWFDLFNYATLPFYWGQYEPEQGKTIYKDMRKTVDYLMDKNVTIKGHPLCWHTVCADWLLSKNNAEIMKLQIERTRREVSDFKKEIPIWDGVNEAVIMPDFDRYDNGITRICKEYGRIDVIKKVFDCAKETNPNAVLLINDFNTSEKYENLISDCLDAGIKIDAIGIQSHQHQGYWGSEKLYDVLDRFSKFKLPIHFTENTFISGDLMPKDIEDLNDFQVKQWPSTKQGLERQCRDIEEFYRILFENPYVEAITNWSFADGEWLGAPSGLIYEDNSDKPSYQVLKHLIKEEWWTNLESETDEQGCMKVTGFLGTYELKINGKNYTFKLTKQGDITLEV